MKGVSLWFIATAAVAIIIGTIWGVVMSATQDHSLSPAHGHLNLIGWVSMAIIGFYYHLVPAAASTRLAQIHYFAALLGLVLIVPGIVIVLQTGADSLAKAGSILTVLGMLIFGYQVFRHGFGNKAAHSTATA